MDRKSWPSFDKSMEYSYYYQNQRENIDDWNIVISRYNLIKNTSLQTTKIPKIVHQIWLGGNMPPVEKKMCNQVKESLPTDWKYILWTEENLDNLKYFKNKNIFNITPNKGQQSDLLRYAILLETGGIYLDTDFILYGSLDYLLDLDFVCGVSYDKSPTLFNGFIGSSPNNNIIKDLNNLDIPIDYSTINAIMNTTGPYLLTRKVMKNIITHSNILILPTSFFYPFPNFDICKQNGSDYTNYIQPETIGCHMWSSSWM